MNTTAATNPPKSKPLFRKLSLKKQKQKPKRLSSTIINNSDSINSSSDGALKLSVQNEHGSDITMDETMLETIMAKKRKRDINQNLRIKGGKIRAKVPNKEALPLVMGLSKGSTSSHSISNTSENGGMLRTTFASSKNDRKAENLNEEIDESTALGRRHKQAMEEYILKKMEKTNVDSKGQSHEAICKSKSSEVLYQELSAKIITQGEDAAGNIVTFTSTGAKIMSKQAAALAAAEKNQEGDIGAGGTMLGGTGIAEVLLPIDHRLDTIRETQEAVMEKMNFQKSRIVPRPAADEQQEGEKNVKWETLLPKNFESGPSKRRYLDPNSPNVTRGSLMKPIKPSKSPQLWCSASSAGEEVLASDVEAVSASYAHNFQLHSHEWISRRKEEQDLEIARQQLSQGDFEGPARDRERVGFSVLRGKEPPGVQRNINELSRRTSESHRSSRRNTDKHRSNDDRVWSSFVKYQKDRGGKRR